MNYEKLLKHTKNLTVLYLEDKDDLRQRFVKIFADLFLIVDEASCGQSGYLRYVEYYNNNGKFYDIVFSDIKMPNMDGVEFSKKVLELNPEQSIIINSAYDESHYLVDLINIGINKFLHKPTSLEALSEVLFEVSHKLTNKKNEKNNILKLEKLAKTDKLSGLYNRAFLDDIIESEIERSNRYETKFSLIFIDIDNFKKINDMYGHHIGDAVIIDFASLLKSNIRKTDIVGRWGGEEFLIISFQNNIDGVLTSAEFLRKKTEEFFFKDIGHITASFGVSIFHKGDDGNSLINRADAAMYKAKNGGKNRVCH